MHPVNNSQRSVTNSRFLEQLGLLLAHNRFDHAFHYISFVISLIVLVSNIGDLKHFGSMHNLNYVGLKTCIELRNNTHEMIQTTSNIVSHDLRELDDCVQNDQ